MGHKTASVGVLWLALALSSAIDVIPGRFRNHGHFVCSTWGNHHFKTFDGDFYQFPGTCSYDFASDCHNSYPEFSIHLHRTTTSHPFVDKITINIKDVVIQLKENIVVVDGGIAKTPYYISGILIHKTNEYFKVYAKIGLTVMWNKEDAVMLELDPKYKNHTCGLCGDYNGIPVFDEFLSGDHFLSPVQFGNLQNIHDPSDECTDLDETLNADHCSQYVNYSTVCEDHLRQAAFSTCHDLLSVEPFIKACVLDMCSCRQSQDSFCLCSTISEFSRQCSHAGGSPGNWRTDSFCPKQCPANMIYQESASPCKNSCSHLEINSLCEEHYMDGCVCPEGTVYDDYMDRGCVAVSECHCKHKGKIYPPGQLVNNDCNTCSCESGKWICTERFCPGVCSIEGGAHFSTFDGKAYTFHGDCYYVLSEGRTNESHHVILGELTPRSSSKRETALKSVILYMDNKQNVVNFKADGTVFLNGLEVTLPHVTASFSIIRPSDSYVIAQSTFGLQMQVQLSPIMQLYITMEKSASTHLQGLCGDFNSKETDDFKTSGGLVEATASAFANTWKIQSNCPDVSDWLDDPCSLSIEKETYARAWCSNLEKADSPFAKCHSTVDPAEYVKRCRYDSCNCRDSEHCMCAALSSYVRACAAKGIILWGWRNGICDNNITSCPSSQVFLYNLTTCQPTCRSLAEGEKACPSVFTPIDGCGCPDGEFLNEKGLCVPVSKCSCYHHGEYLSPLEMISKQDELCICHNGKHVCSVHSNQTCPEGKVYHNCSRDEKEALAHRSCKTLGVEYFQSECMPGCVCPYGLLDDGAGGCVPEEQCPCVHNKDIYPHGAEITVDCNTCSCQRGRWSCTNAVCYGTCTIYGSGHYITFDEKLYDFDGECEFVAARDYCGPNHSEGNFSIITENVRCGTTGFTCSKAIKVFLGDKILKLSEKTLQEMEGQGIKHVDYVTRDVGIYLVIEARIGILLIWDRKTTLFIKVSPVYKGKLCGLCGNFDGNSQNDFKTSQMLPVTNVLEFGNSWKLNPTCPDQAELINPCKQNPHRRSWAEKQCSLIISPVFQACHSKLDPKPFYEACVTDACSCDSGGDCECFCTAVAAYAQECTKAGACVYWRTPDICPIFCDYYNPKDKCEWHYHPCGNHSVQTCRSIYNIYSKVTITYLEGCYPTCPPDRPIFDEEKRICVNKEQCGCYYNNALYEFGEEVPDYQDCQKCVCNPGKISCTAKDDYINSTTIRDGLCYVTGCKNGTITDGVTICANVTTTTTSVTSVTTTPVTTTTTTTTTTVFRTLPQATTPYSSSTACIYEKVCQWTSWFDVSNPGMDPNGGDYETYNDLRKHYEFCSVPERIQCRAVNAPDISLEHLKQTVHCNVSYGLICENSEQKADENLWQRCYDYEIRVHCCNQECVNSTAQTTISSTATVPTTTSSIITSTVPSTTISTTTATTTTTPTTTAPTTSASFTTIHPETSSTVVSTTGPTTTIQTTTSPIHLSSSSVTTTTNITSPTTYSTTATNITTTVPTTFTITSPSPTGLRKAPLRQPKAQCTHQQSQFLYQFLERCAPVCSWSQWYDVSYPTINSGGEYETYENIRNHGYHICEKPKSILCRSKSHPDNSIQELNRKVTCDVSYGLICINDLRRDLRPCHNYEIKVYCCEVPDSCSATTPANTTTEPSTPTSPTTKATSTTTRKTPTPVFTTESTKPTTGTTETPVTSTTSIITPAGTTQEILSTSGGTTPPTTKVTTPSTIPELPSTMSTASGTLPVTTAVTTMSVPSTSVGTTLTTPCVCMFNGEPFPPGEIVTGASADFCYAVICNEECNIEVSDWICSTPSPTNTPTISSSSSPTHESTVTLSTRPTTSTMTKATSTSTITKPTLTSSQTKPTSTSTPTKASLTSTLTKPSSVSTSTTTFTITKPSSTSTMTKLSSTSTVTKPTTTSTQTKSTSTSTLTKASSTSTLTKPSSASTLTNPASNSALTIATSTSKPTTTTVQVGSTTDNGCMFGNYREKNETWMLCNCTTATCVGNNFIEVTQIKCEPPPKITCANGQPPIPVPDDDLCCWHWECECICSGWGDPHFLTFDGTYYSFQGNCTYTLVEEIDKRIDNFGIYIDNYDCGDLDRVSCPRGIIVRHETQEIKMTRKSLDVRHSDIEVSVNGELVGVPFKKYGVKIFRSGVYHVVEIPNLGTNITFNGEDFSVKMPYRHFGNNTQGQCGTCTNSQADDCMTPSGDILSSCEVMANTWIVEDPNKPACGLMKPVTPPETKERDVPCTPSPICDLIFKLPFMKCHGTVLPEAYYQACVFDSCSVPSANMACTSLQHYAHLCGDKGICIDWRHLAPECSMNCPSQQVYNACGPALPRTCQTTQEEAAQINGDTRYTEGCFCPANTMLFSQDVNVCVSTCGCLGPDKRPRKFGEEFQLDCQDCVCREGGSGITCRKRQCGEMKPVNCDLEGFYADIQTSSNDTCCNESVCKCDSSQCSSKPPSCDLGYEVVGAVPEGHCCPVYSCVRRSVCVHGNAEYMPGSPVYSADKCQSCVCSESTNTTAGVEIECTPLICNIQCPEGFKVKRSTQNCCGECEQTHCVLSQDGLNQLLKPGKNVQSDDNCTVYSCSEIRGKFITSISSFSCPPFNEDNCEPGTVTVLSNGCCKICVEKSTSCKLYEDYEYLYHNSCRSTEKVKISRCDGLCETLSIYSAAAGAMSHKCSCCQEVQSSQKRVTLQCTDGSQVEHQYINVEECNCVNTDCGTTPSLQNIHPKIPGAE
ncbi:mucin-2 [Gastrophryne carolinensis]